jgi:hypothetical protein
LEFLPSTGIKADFPLTGEARGSDFTLSGDGCAHLAGFDFDKVRVTASQSGLAAVASIPWANHRETMTFSFHGDNWRGIAHLSEEILLPLSGLTHLSINLMIVSSVVQCSAIEMTAEIAAGEHRLDVRMKPAESINVLASLRRQLSEAIIHQLSQELVQLESDLDTILNEREDGLVSTAAPIGLEAPSGFSRFPYGGGQATPGASQAGLLHSHHGKDPSAATHRMSGYLGTQLNAPMTGYLERPPDGYPTHYPSRVAALQPLFMPLPDELQLREPRRTTQTGSLEPGSPGHLIAARILFSKEIVCTLLRTLP